MAFQAEEVAKQLENGNQDPAKMLIAVEAVQLQLIAARVAASLARAAIATTVRKCYESLPIVVLPGR